MTSFTKDPEAVLDYAFDWTAWLAEGETIAQATVTADTGITVDSTSHDGAVVTAWVSGGTADQSYYLECLVTTTDTRTDERRARISVRNR